ncbi:SDR family oxidoreductase [Bacillus sp. es.036]|uniref:SDR family oxidoreductase n=1 Tax=Bacillus sp. es.036 TaxID=1761764 RepID=UPI000BF451BF|nr:SDR family oxidoreductase [Bacillus sp. es.036]PFG12112.1 3-oxoacyl-[acyl-carrier protein] reductase [Bacillus sp. es.036]
MNQERRIAIVTGASRPNGIGAALCRELAQEGYNLFFTHFSPYDYKTGYNDAEANWAEVFENELRDHGVRVESMELDLSKSDAPAQLLERVLKMRGQLSILVNNATHCVEMSHEELTSGVLDEHYAVNVRGTCMLSVAFAKQLKKDDLGGRIINFVSGQDKSPQPGNLPYITTKGAISAFTTSFATEVASQHITVNAIDPGPTNSGAMDRATQDFLKPKFPTGRIGRPEDAARLVNFLTSDAANWITGQIIHSDGGFRD